MYSGVGVKIRINKVDAVWRDSIRILLVTWPTCFLVFIKKRESSNSNANPHMYIHLYFIYVIYTFGKKTAVLNLELKNWKKWKKNWAKRYVLITVSSYDARHASNWFLLKINIFFGEILSFGVINKMYAQPVNM